jgi:hypothetical protein
MGAIRAWWDRLRAEQAESASADRGSAPPAQPPADADRTGAQTSLDQVLRRAEGRPAPAEGDDASA